jgi:hypothetical protein
MAFKPHPKNYNPTQAKLIWNAQIHIEESSWNNGMLENQVGKNMDGDLVMTILNSTMKWTAQLRIRELGVVKDDRTGGLLDERENRTTLYS